MVFFFLNPHIFCEDPIKIIIPTFLGNSQRNCYGDELPDSLSIIWKLNLGEGETVISRKLGSRKWAGAGWTGQPLLVKENKGLFLILGAYDHNLKKINAENRNIEWQYRFDDVIKGTGSIWENYSTKNAELQLIILQGSRLGIGNYLDSDNIPSFRAISYYTGKELWQPDVKWTDSYSRDVDGSALIIDYKTTETDSLVLSFDSINYVKIPRLIFRKHIGPSISTPVFCKDKLLAAGYDGVFLFSFNKKLSFKITGFLPYPFESTPIFYNKKVYIASRNGYFYCLGNKL